MSLVRDIVAGGGLFVAAACVLEALEVLAGGGRVANRLPPRRVP